MRVTIKDIASVAGVSYSTVSKALNNSPLVKDHTKRRIVAISKELGYQPNFAAQSLVSSKTKVIGLIWPTIERAVLSTLVTKISDEINQTPYSMILSIDPIQKAIDTFNRFNVDGIILFEENIDVHMELHKTPLLSYGATRSGAQSYPVIDPNYGQAMFMAVEYLVKLGHTKIAYVGDLSSDDPMQKEKSFGFKNAIDRLGLTFVKEYFIDTNGLDWYDGFQATSQLLGANRRPTAIVGGSYDISGGITRGILEKQLQIPRDISVISYDNIPQMDNLEIPMTCIGVPVDQLAVEIVQAMIELIETNDSTQGDICRKMDPILVQRNSCAPPKKRHS